MILIVGGTGTLGRQLAPILLARGMRVRLLARHDDAVGRAAVTPGADYVAGDVRDGSVVRRALEGVETVVSAMAGFGGRDALGSRAVDREGNLALIDAARAAGVGHVILVSIHDAAADHPMELFRDKWAAEEALRASGLDSTILRPTAYLETWLGLVGGPLVTTGRTRIFGGGRNPVNFVSARDVARFVELAVVDASLRGATIEVPGPANLTLDELADAVERATGTHGQRQHLPVPMMRLARLVMRLPKPILSAQIAAAIAMDERDMTVDGPRLRAAHPSIAMTPADDVARALFAPPGAEKRNDLRPIGAA